MTFDLLLGDCLDRMSQMQDGSVDLTVTSPPYDNLRTYNDSLNDWSTEKWQAILRELFRVTKDGGVVVWVVADATIKGSETGTSFRQALYAMECGFKLHDTMIYQKAGTGACGSNKSYWQSFEYMFVFAKGTMATVNRIADHENVRAGGVCTQGRLSPAGVKRNLQRRVIPNYSVRTNVWRYHVGNNGEDRGGHPAVFPKMLAQDHIISWSREGETVFDPFMGSGTTGVAALNTGRNFIGIERDADYFEIARKRIENAQPESEAVSFHNDNNPILDPSSRAFMLWLTAI